MTIIRTELSASTLGAFRWNFLGFISRSIAALIVGVVLARLLGPEPFGILGVAAIVFGLGNQFADGGFSSALVQAPELSESNIRFAFTMQILIGCSMTALVFATAPLFGVLFRDSSVVNVLRVVSLLFLIQAFGQTSAALLSRRMEFRTLQIAQVTSYLIGYGAVGISAACLGFGVWSLVAAQLMQPLIYSVHTYWYVRHSIRPCIHRSGLRLMRFGTQITSANLLNWTIGNLDNVLVGRAFGAIGLGLYSRVFNLLNTPVTGFVSALQQVLFASCSRTTERPDRARRAYLAALGGVALVTLPLFWSLATSARLAVLGLLGPKWIDAVPLFAALSLAMPLFALMAIAGPILSASDQVSQEIRTQAVSLFVCCVLFLLAVHVSLRSMAWAVLFAYLFRFWWTSRPTLQLLNLKWREVLGMLAGPAFAALIVALCVFLGSHTILANTATPVVALLGAAIVGTGSFVAVTVIGGRYVVPKVFLEPLLGRPDIFPHLVVRSLKFLAARWHPEVPIFAQTNPAPLGVAESR